jgi:RluA family pseudouridine synthase
VRLVYEDDDLVVIDKPAGLVTADPSKAAGAPAEMRPSARLGETVFEIVKHHVKNSMGARRRRREGDEGESHHRSGRVWVIHRLDKEASGLLVFAKTHDAFDALKTAFENKDVHRVYTAVAEGILGEPGAIGTQKSFIHEDRGLREDPRSESAPSHDDQRRLAITHYKVLQTGSGRTLLNARLDTGRKNQIRIHMRELGHPLIGDRRFGAVTDPIGRLALHATELGFTHPGTRKQLRFTSPAPASFFRAVGALAPNNADDSPPASSLPKSATKGVNTDTSWNNVADWYDTLLEDRTNDHYDNTVIPGTLALLGDIRNQTVLDLACGQGIISRRMAELGARVIGVDAAPRLIEAARKRSPDVRFEAADARDIGVLKLTDVDQAICVMALSNIDPLAPVFAGVASALKPSGSITIVIAHPTFRVPGRSDWGWDDRQWKQYRRVDAYLSPFEREIQMHPGKAASGKPGGDASTPTFHRPLSAYIHTLHTAGFAITHMQEWISQRAASSGPRADEENRARKEFPLFLALKAIKL